MSPRSRGARKAAITLSLLGEDAAASILKHLEDSESSAVLAEVARIKTISPLEHGEVLAELQQMILESRGIERVGLDRAKTLVSRYAPDRVDEVFDMLGNYSENEDDESLPQRRNMPNLPAVVVEASTSTIARALQGEHPQTIAFVLSALSPTKAARILENLNLETRIEVSRRIAEFESVNPQVLSEIGEVLSVRIAELSEDGTVQVDGVRAAADCLAALGRSEGREVLEALEADSPELVAELRDMLFTFDMLLLLDDRDLPEVLKQVDRSTLAMALKGAEPELADKIFKGMSGRAATMLKEEIEYLGAPRVSEIEQAQKVVIDALLELEKSGAITIPEAGVATS